ncbi:MAG: RICIN domain-containing protein [Bdellovibrionales bacterium]|nr:RICIN domain-containing protein [Bdellovibrionales bacterium]
MSKIHQLIPQNVSGGDQGMGFVQLGHFKPGQNYIIYAVHSNGLKCLDIAQDEANYGKLILYTFSGAPNQRFVF